MFGWISRWLRSIGCTSAELSGSGGFRDIRRRLVVDQYALHRELSERTVPATRIQLNQWMKNLPVQWTVAMEATMFAGWFYDRLLPHTEAVKVAPSQPQDDNRT